jgi:sporulation protein YlmC with PRC-barrel domain
MGARVSATDGECGELVRVIVDPVAQKLTDLVVAPRHHGGLGRLVPLRLVDSVEDGHVRLNCTVADFGKLDDAQDVQFLPPDADNIGNTHVAYSPHALLWPYYSLMLPLGGGHHQPIFSDRIPLDAVEVVRGDAVHALDGLIGSVQGLVIDPSDHHVTHVLLQEGHIWGHKQVAIPIGAATRVGDEIQVGLTKQQVEDLPPVQLR